jgi:hypothetical protein
MVLPVQHLDLRLKFNNLLNKVPPLHLHLDRDRPNRRFKREQRITIRCKRSLQSCNLKARGHQICRRMRPVSFVDTWIKFDQDLPGRNLLPLVDMNSANDPGFKRLDHLRTIQQEHLAG